MSEESQVAVISGAERGLGRAIALLLADAGMLVVATAREIRLAEAVVQEIAARGGRSVAHVLDVLDRAGAAALAKTLDEQLGRVDVLVNNAGICVDTDAHASDTDLDIVKETLETNLFGAWRLCQAMLPLMKRRGYGRIINISSAMGQLETMGSNSPAYRVSKTALNALTCMLAAEVEGTDILVNSVEPGWMRTDMGGPEAPRSAETGAETPVWLATMPKGGKSGSFFFDRRLIPW
jgi:NAD(P)-dependent dehydrogenase (short-subunit alcohol dehydrogenase family)